MASEANVKTADTPKVVVDTISDHYSRQASPAVWAEVDELRKRVTNLEALVSALRGDLP